MRTIHTLLIGGLGVGLLAGAAVAASHEHVMAVKLSDGTVARIAYIGHTPPKVNVVQGVPQDPFAEMDRMSALMDQRMALMMRQVAAVQGAGGQAPADDAPRMVAFTNLPSGAQVHYSYTSTTMGADGCARTVSWRSDGPSGAQPKLVKTSSGACGAEAGHAADAKPLMTSAPAPEKATPSHKI